MKLAQGDSVIVISGKDKGKKGSILRVLHSVNRVVVGGVNMVKKHVKATAQSAGRISTFERSISASNVMVLDPKSGKPTRIGFKVDPKTGAKTRIAKLSGEVLTRTKIAASSDADKKEKATKKAEKASSGTETPSKKSPFWQRIGFGKDATSEPDADAPAGQGAAPAAQTIRHRSASRGS